MYISLIMLTMLATTLLAKHPKRRRSRYTLRGVRVTPTLALGTLNSAIVVKVGLTGASTISYRAISVIGTWALSGLTAGEGPIICGFAHSDYTITEISEAITSATSISPGLKIEEEKSNRLVRQTGILGPAANTVLNNGNPVKTRLNWQISASASGNEVVMFAFNDGANLTTGANLKFNGKIYVKDSI